MFDALYATAILVNIQLAKRPRAHHERACTSCSRWNAFHKFYVATSHSCASCRCIASINLVDPTLSGNDRNAKRLQEASHAVHNLYAIMCMLGPAIYDRHRVTSCNSSGMGTNTPWVWRINGVVHDVHVMILKLQSATYARHMVTSCNIELVVY